MTDVKGFERWSDIVKKATTEKLAEYRKERMDWLDDDLDVDERHDLRARFYRQLAEIESELHRRDLEWDLQHRRKQEEKAWTDYCQVCGERMDNCIHHGGE